MTTNNAEIRLGGVAEVAAELGVSRQQVANLRERDDFPAPIASLSSGDVWDLNVVKRWNSSGLRRAAGRPARGTVARVLGRRFELGSEIDSGGFAVVYNAQDLTATTEKDAKTAVKVLQAAHALDRRFVARFERELEIMSGLSHSAVMPLLASGTDDRLGLWYAMPLARRSLQDDIGQVTELEEIVGIMRDVCSGLAYIHGEEILHRDLKPSNVLRHKGHWRIADFGLARDVAQQGRLTTTFDAFGSHFYTAPEQWTDAKHVDERADIYSAGKIMQALVSGTAPADDNVPAGPLRAVILRAVSQDPDRRHRTAEELLGAIEGATAPAPSGKWETPGEIAVRLRPRLEGGQDTDALKELMGWADHLNIRDFDQVSEFDWTFSALPRVSIQRWWNANPSAFKHAFRVFAEGLSHGFDFNRCDALADVTRRVVDAVPDSEILRDAVCGLAQLGHNHNRWHVRDVAVALIQSLRSADEATSALEGLRMAGTQATEWTLGESSVKTLHPTLRAGIPQLLDED